MDGHTKKTVADGDRLEKALQAAAEVVDTGLADSASRIRDDGLSVCGRCVVTVSLADACSFPAGQLSW